jgi:hypothetical protein
MWALAFCLLALNGCSSLTAKREKQEIVEAELRAQERHIMDLKAEVERKEGHIHGLDLELERAQQAAIGQKSGEPQSPGVIKEITLGRLTGGYRNNPRSNFDDSLQFLVEPRDADGHSIKVPGSLHIELFEITPAGLKNMLSSWDITQRELRRSWDQPLIGSPAYRILIPFKALPAHERMRVVVRLIILDGKPFEAERDFTIRLPGPGAGLMLPMTGVPPGGYTVVTPGHMINGNLVGPLNPPPAAPLMNSAPAASLPQPPVSIEGTGRSAEPAKTEKQPEKKESEKKEFVPPPAPVLEPLKKDEMPEQKKEEKKDSIPVIPVKPRDVPATITTPGGVPPLPPPPEVPQFDKNAMNLERLPVPSNQPRTSQPLYPTDSGVVQAGYAVPSGSKNMPSPIIEMSATVPLTAAPPSSWRTKHGPSAIVEQNPEPAIKLSRPIVVKP